MINQKNLIVATRLGGGPKESWCGLGRVGYASGGNEGAKVKGGAHKPLPLPNGGV
jgi:hypothetical protein